MRRQVWAVMEGSTLRLVKTCYRPFYGEHIPVNGPFKSERAARRAFNH